MTRRLTALTAAGALMVFGGCGDDAEQAQDQAEDVQNQVNDAIDEAQQQAEDAQEAVEDPAGEAQEQLEQGAQEQLQGEGGE